MTTKKFQHTSTFKEWTENAVYFVLDCIDVFLIVVGLFDKRKNEGMVLRVWNTSMEDFNEQTNIEKDTEYCVHRAQKEIAKALDALL